VFGAANTTKRGGQRPHAALASLAENSDATYKVAVVHGSLVNGVIDSSSDEVLIEPAEVAAGPFDYVAGGHWHRRQARKFGQTWFCYPGCPETLGFDDSPSPGTVTLVTLGDEATLEERLVGKNKWVTMTADVTLATEAEIAKRARSLSATESLLRLRLVGTPNSPVDLDGLSDELTDLFLYVDIDDSQIAPDTPETSGFPENSVARAFVEIMNDRIKRAADAVERDVLQEALRQGCLYLTGRAVMRP
jgi:DNA repair exonuclease SbcCD nuclease subunit